MSELELQAELARLIKRAARAAGRGWCATTPRDIARYLVEQGVTLPQPEETR